MLCVDYTVSVFGSNSIEMTAPTSTQEALRSLLGWGKEGPSSALVPVGRVNQCQVPGSGYNVPGYICRGEDGQLSLPERGRCGKGTTKYYACYPNPTPELMGSMYPSSWELMKGGCPKGMMRYSVGNGMNLCGNRPDSSYYLWNKGIKHPRRTKKRTRCVRKGGKKRKSTKKTCVKRKRRVVKRKPTIGKTGAASAKRRCKRRRASCVRVRRVRKARKPKMSVARKRALLSQLKCLISKRRAPARRRRRCGSAAVYTGVARSAMRSGKAGILDTVLGAIM